MITKREMTNTSNVERTKAAMKKLARFLFIGDVWLLSDRSLLAHSVVPLTVLLEALDVGGAGFVLGAEILIIIKTLISKIQFYP